MLRLRKGVLGSCESTLQDPGGSGKAEGFADGGWPTIGKPALAAATQMFLSSCGRLVAREELR
jgi:hypothetical protein